MSKAMVLCVAVATVAATCLLPVTVAAAESFRYLPTDALVEKLSAELARYARAGDREERGSPVRPGPSRELAYLLLKGLAAHGPPPEPLDAGAIDDLAAAGPSSASVLRGQDPRMRRTVVRLNPRLWVVFADTTVQDKAITFIDARAILYVKTSAGWKERGSGSAARLPSGER